MDFSYFPFDKQKCDLNFFARELSTEVVFVFDPRTAYNKDYNTNGEWDVLTIIAEGRPFMTFPNAYASFQIEFEFKVRSTSFDF